MFLLESLQDILEEVFRLIVIAILFGFIIVFYGMHWLFTVLSCVNVYLEDSFLAQLRMTNVVKPAHR